MKSSFEIEHFNPRQPKGLIRRTFVGLGLVVFFPFALLASIIYLIVLSARMAWILNSKPIFPGNTTPCGSLCEYSKWNKKDKIWRCNAKQGYDCNVARSNFIDSKNPNNCCMFKIKEIND